MLFIRTQKAFAWKTIHSLIIDIFKIGKRGDEPSVLFSDQIFEAFDNLGEFVFDDFQKVVYVDFSDV